MGKKNKSTIKLQSSDWESTLNKCLNILLKQKPIAFKGVIPSKIPAVPGIYLITKSNRNLEKPYYIGRSKNLRQRIYHNHLMGPLSNARLKNYLVKLGECTNKDTAKMFIRSSCSVRWIISKDLPKKLSFSDYRLRGVLESYFTAILFPKYGIYEEH